MAEIRGGGRSAKNHTNSTFGLYPSKGVEELRNNLVDLRNERVAIKDNQMSLKEQALKAMLQIARFFDKENADIANFDLDVSAYESPGSHRTGEG